MAKEQNETPETVAPKVKKTRKPNAKARYVVTLARPVANRLEELAKQRGLDVPTMLEFDAIAEFQASQKEA